MNATEIDIHSAMFRYARTEGQTEKNIPVFRMERIRAGFEIEGTSQGVAVAGMPVQLAQWDGIKQIRISVQLKTDFVSTMEGNKLYMGLFTKAQWDGFAQTNTEAAPFLFGGEFYHHVDDSVMLQELFAEPGEQDWESYDLLPWLRDRNETDYICAILLRKPDSDSTVLLQVSHMEIRELTQDDIDLETFSNFSDVFLEENGIKPLLAQGKLDEAAEAVAAYYKKRQNPHFYPLGEMTEEDKRCADDALKHIFAPVGIAHGPVKLDKLDWNADPIGYDQWMIAFSRCQHWEKLAKAYVHTLDERYAEEFVQELTTFIDQTPFFFDQGVAFIEGPVFEPGRLSSYLDAGSRLSFGWWIAFEAFKSSPSLHARDMVRMLGSFCQQADYLADRRTENPRSNWGALAINGLLTTAMLLPEMRKQPEWMETGISRLKETMRVQFYPDGAQVELTPGYHWGAVSSVCQPLQLAKYNEIELGGGMLSKLEISFDFLAKLAMPSLRAPSFNDSPWKPVGQAMKKGYEIFPERKDFLWFATEGREGREPDYGSVFLPYCGYCALRTGFREEDNCLLFDVGPFGFSHHHEDKLNFVIGVGKDVLLSEAGVYNYDHSAWSTYSIGSDAHNVIKVDGKPQRRAFQPETHVTDEPIDGHFVTTDQYDYIEGTYGDGFFEDGSPEVVHRRQIVFVKPDYWIIADTLTPEDDKKHAYEAMFHFAVDSISLHNPDNSVEGSVEGKSINLTPVSAHALTANVIQGQTEPYIQGWIRNVDFINEPKPTVSYSWSAEGVCRVFYVMEAVRDGKTPIVEIIPELQEGELRAMTIRQEDGGACVVAAAKNEKGFILKQKDANGNTVFKIE